jgi:excisionase family DNA binding protein
MLRDTKNFANRRRTDFAMLTVRDLEALLKIDQKTIYRYVALGLIPYVRIQSNIRFIKEEIEGWVDTQSFEPRSGGRRASH